MTLNKEEVYGIKFEGIDYKDYPKFCDAYISEAKIADRDLTDDEIEELNSDSDYRYNQLMNFIY